MARPCLIVVYFLVARGWRAINWTFLTQPPMDSMTKGGILPCIVGTLCLSIGAIVVALPIGVASAIYLNEYARPGRIVRIIRLGINNLAGVPSVVFGLFGLAFFVVYLKMGVSILAGALTLGALTLPVIIGATEEALQGRSGYLPGGVPGSGGHQMADHLPGGAAGGPARHSYRRHLGHEPGGRRNRPHHVHGGRVFHTVFADIHF